MKKYYLLHLALLSLSIGHTQESKGKYNEAIRLIEIWLNAQKDYESMPGIMAMVVKDQELLWSGAFGMANLEKNTPAEPTTICSVCSITKTFTAVAILKLVDEGKLNLDAAVKDILPSFKVKQRYPEGGDVTVRSILAHASGLPRDSGHSYWSAPDFPFPTRDELLLKLEELETLEGVGTDLKYSNLGYAILGQIVETVSGRPYRKYLKEEVLNPLGMLDSHIELQEALYGNEHAIGYSASNREGKRKRAATYQTRAMQSVAGLSTTVLDLAKYASWHFRLREATAKEILEPATIRTMHDVQSTSKSGGRTWGLGFEVFSDKDGNKWLSHGGICPGYVSFIRLDLTNKLGYAVLINANRVFARKYVKGISDIISKVAEEPEKLPSEVHLQEYVGYYNLKPWNSEYYISTWGTGLVTLYLPTEDPANSIFFYEHVTGDVFQLVGGNGELGSQLIFQRNSDGEVFQVKNEGNYHLKMEGQN